MSNRAHTPGGGHFEYGEEVLALRGQIVFPPESYVLFSCGRTPEVELAVDVFTDVTRRHTFKFRAPEGMAGDGRLRQWLDEIRRTAVRKLLQVYYGGRLPQSVKVPAVLRRLVEEVERLAERGRLLPNIYTIRRFDGLSEAAAHILVAHILLDLVERCLTSCPSTHGDDAPIARLRAEVRVDFMREAPEKLGEAEVVSDEKGIEVLLYGGYQKYREWRDSQKTKDSRVDLSRDYSLLEHMVRGDLTAEQPAPIIQA